MSWSNFMNIEVLALKIIDKQLELMTENNYKLDGEDSICDEILFENNLEHGWIIVVMLMNYLESLLNTILRDCVNCVDDTIMKSSIEDKMVFLCSNYKKEYSDIKNCQYWSALKMVTNIRNELIHYKYNYQGDSGIGLPSIKIGKHIITDIFNQSRITNLKERFIKFCEYFINELGLNINSDARLFDSDGRIGLVSYIIENELK